jgi:hypothetical protein
LRDLNRERAKRNNLARAERVRSNPELRRAINDGISRWRAQNPDKKRAHDRVAKALRTGTLVRPERCEICGTAARVHGHHEDYAKPLEVRWLCPGCHGAAHQIVA